MLEVIKTIQKADIVHLEDMEHYSVTSTIIVAERENNSSCQSILIQERSGHFYWNNFYLRNCDIRTRYYSVKEAIESRFDKGYKVFLLSNKTEFREFIKTRWER